MQRIFHRGDACRQFGIEPGGLCEALRQILDDRNLLRLWLAEGGRAEVLRSQPLQHLGNAVALLRGETARQRSEEAADRFVEVLIHGHNPSTSRRPSNQASARKRPASITRSSSLG